MGLEYKKRTKIIRRDARQAVDRFYDVGDCLGTGFLDVRLLGLNLKLLAMSERSESNGGGGGSRTRVRKYSTMTSTYLA